MTSIAAHVILGPREEPFLSALLTSLDGVVDIVIVNDNSLATSPHTHALNASTFAAHKALIVDRTPFTDFATARNICLKIHRERKSGDWAAFADADEVHGDTVKVISKNLGRVPAGIDFVDGYTWHFFQSPDFYTSIERRMMFFRVTPEVRWEGRVHEQLRGLHGRRVALPYVYGHYGHVLPPRRHAEKGRLYSSLGQSGEIVAEDQLDTIDPSEYFRNIWPRLLRFHGEHPPAVRPTLEHLRAELREQFAMAHHFVGERQPWLQRQRNALEALNYEQRWRSRFLNLLAYRLMAKA